MATPLIIVVSAIVGDMVVIRTFKDRPISKMRAAREVIDLSGTARDLRYYHVASTESP